MAAAEAAPSTNGHSSSYAGDGAAAAAVATYVFPMEEELERKKRLFLDDVDFIAEVRAQTPRP